MNRVYFIGAGPGDPELLTLKGGQCLARCAVVFAPTPFEQTFAAHLAGKTVLVPFDFYYDELLARIEAGCERGDVTFLVPGDLTFYSPFQALVDALGERAEVIPGVGTANAAAARLKKTLDLPDVCTRAIIASPRTLGEGEGVLSLRELAAPGVTLLIYMNNIPLPELAAQLKEGYGASVPIAILHRLGLPGEAVVTGTLDDIVDKVGERDFFNLSGPTRRASLTLVIAGETLTATVDGSWWDWRREHVWKFLSGGEQ
jgi:precorrin-4/cobalt-precorrin-4 C11-methyltransferase